MRISDRLADMLFIFVMLGRVLRAGLLCDVHRTTADNCTTACAGAKFRKSHFYRHSVTSLYGSSLAGWPERSPDFTVQGIAGHATRLTHFLAYRGRIVRSASKTLRLMFHLGAVLHG
jgi:hypothetical protein